MTLHRSPRSRLIVLGAFALVLLVGAMFSVMAAVAALLASLALAAPTWFMREMRTLRFAWYGALLTAAAVVYFVAPGAVVGGAVSSCNEMPTFSIPDREHYAAVDETMTTKDSPSESVPATVQPQAGLTSKAAYLVSAESNQVRYEERVDLHLKQGYFVNLDLTELGQQATRLAARTEILVGGDGMVAGTFAPNELAGTIGLSTQPSSVWIEVRMLAPPGATPICTGVTLMPFQQVRLHWPQPSSTSIRGTVRLPSGNAPIAFTQPIDRNRSQLSEVALPRYALFRQRPALLKSVNSTSKADLIDRFEPSAAVHVAGFSMIAEFAPDNRFVRNAWTYRKQDLFFPLNWTLALLYVLAASAIGERGMRR